jgi:hypothetical protein
MVIGNRLRELRESKKCLTEPGAPSVSLSFYDTYRSDILFVSTVSANLAFTKLGHPL